MSACKTERLYRKIVNYETQRHLDSVRAKFLKQYQDELNKPAQQALTSQMIELVEREYR